MNILKVIKCIMASSVLMMSFITAARPPLCNDRPLDPLMIDLGHDGIHLGRPGVTVSFDLMGMNIPNRIQWVAVKGNDAFLIYDRNGNGIADNGSEMFTNFNYLETEHRFANNGFVDLAQYDQPTMGGNDDGYISQDDDIWQQLLLWLDKNADGVASPDEMLSLASQQLTHLPTIGQLSPERDKSGNTMPLWAWAKSNLGANSVKFKMVDVYFKGD